MPQREREREREGIAQRSASNTYTQHKALLQILFCGITLCIIKKSYKIHIDITYLNTIRNRVTPNFLFLLEQFAIMSEVTRSHFLRNISATQNQQPQSDSYDL
jgi:hypothetical protein